MTAAGLSRIYTLTDKTSRKIEQLAGNPAVCWMFPVPEFLDTVTLLGTARPLSSPMVTNEVWDRLVRITRPYVMCSMDEDRHPELVVIESQIEQVEFLSPRLKVLQPRVIKLNQS